MTDLEAFAKELIRISWDGCDGGDMEPGDPWFVFSGLLARKAA